MWSGERGAAPFFETLVWLSDDIAGLSPTLRARLDEAAVRASEAYGELGTWLREFYAPAAAETDAVGEARYRLYTLGSLGADIDFTETYQWGWDKLFRIEAEMSLESARYARTNRLEGTDIAETIAMARNRQRSGDRR